MHQPDDQEREHAGKHHVADEMPARHHPETAMPVPSASAAPTATARQGGGASTAGAMVQNAPDTSPDTKEQLLGQSPRGSHQGDEMLVAAELRDVDRPRPAPVILEHDVDEQPGPKRHRRHQEQDGAARDQQLAPRKHQLDASAASAGATSTVPTQRPASRASISGG